MEPSRGQGGQKYKKRMKMSTPTVNLILLLLLSHCSYALKWNTGKGYLTGHVNSIKLIIKGHDNRNKAIGIPCNKCEARKKVRQVTKHFGLAPVWLLKKGLFALIG